MVVLRVRKISFRILFYTRSNSDSLFSFSGSDVDPQEKGPVNPNRYPAFKRDGQPARDGAVIGQPERKSKKKQREEELEKTCNMMIITYPDIVLLPNYVIRSFSATNQTEGRAKMPSHSLQGKPQKVIFLVVRPLRPFLPPLELSGHIFFRIFFRA